MSGPMVVQLTAEDLEALVRKAVRAELAERGYATELENLTKEQAAKLFGVTTRTVTSWMAREGMPHRKGLGGHVIFQRDKVLEWAREHGVPVRKAA